MNQALNEELLHIGIHASEQPDRPAVIWANTGEVLSFSTLDQRSTCLAQYFRAHGLRRGDHIAIVMENTPDYYTVCWAAQRSGLYYTPINWHLTPAEVAYMVQDCGAKALVISPSQLVIAQEIDDLIPSVNVRLVAGPDNGDFISLQTAYSGHYAVPLDQSEGLAMCYSSGTTGRPKGIKRLLPEGQWGSRGPVEQFITSFYHMQPSTVYLCPAPLYHAAPLGWSMMAQRMGGAVVLMERFDALQLLQLVERYRVTFAQFVPTMFVRMLNLPQEQRDAFDLSSLQTVVHAAAPCPPDVKRKMIDWLGPVIYEFYAGSEANGLCAVSTQEWLPRPGTVGRALFGQLHIVDDDGNELPPGEIGTICFDGPKFEYHNDPEKTRSAYTPQGWSTLGDIGYVDKDGYLFLSDRRTDLIISGGVNIYPRETEETLLRHAAVLDAAVVGIPHPDFGEEVLAVVELKDGVAPSRALEQELIAFCREHMAHFKCPKHVEFAPLPRMPTGKLLRRNIKEQYRDHVKA